MARRTLRLSEELSRRVSEASDERGFGTGAAFIRSALENELARNDNARALSALEERTAASIRRLTDEVHKLKAAQQVAITLTDALAKVLLTCIPEPDSQAAVARGKERYQRYLRASAAGVKGDMVKALQELQ